MKKEPIESTISTGEVTAKGYYGLRAEMTFPAIIRKDKYDDGSYLIVSSFGFSKKRNNPFAKIYPFSVVETEHNCYGLATTHPVSDDIFKNSQWKKYEFRKYQHFDIENKQYDEYMQKKSIH